MDLKEQLVDTFKDAAIAFLILLIILGSLYGYSGRWPPMVVVESSSMSHSNPSQLGVVDPGDIVVVKQTDNLDIETYVEGKADDHRTYGQYGDVIIYRRLGNPRRTPIIHRAVIYLMYNETSHTFDIPALEGLEYGEDWTTSQGERTRGLNGSVIIHDYGYDDIQVKIDLKPLTDTGHSGFITMGDSTRTNAPMYDQRSSICPEPVKKGWVEGKARGELPWFGTLKLITTGKTGDIPMNTWVNLSISLAVILGVPFILDVVERRYWEKEEEEEKEKSAKEGRTEEKEKVRRAARAFVGEGGDERGRDERGGGEDSGDAVEADL